MGNRLSRIYTRTGDDGTTGLAGGERVSKASLIIEAIGAVDELNCAFGVLLAGNEVLPEERPWLLRIQHELFELGGELSMPEYQTLGDDHVAALEARLDELNGELPPLTEFILPGGSPGAAQAHATRALCRRVERILVHLNQENPVRPALLHYLNRLSDLLFVLARTLGRRGGGEILWQHDRSKR